ncbi:MAG TPA: hypothetical protein VF540_03805 [Segetibacter sp.]
MVQINMNHPAYKFPPHLASLHSIKYFKRERKTEKKKKKVLASGGEAGGKEATQ